VGWIADLLKEIPSAARYKAELEEMEGENSQLKQKICSLESENEKLRQEIQRRDDIVQKEKPHDNLLDKVKTNILLLLSKRQDRLTDEQIAQTIKTNLQIVKFHLQELTIKHMVDRALSINSPSQWYLAQEGRKYLIENKLIS